MDQLVSGLHVSGVNAALFSDSDVRSVVKGPIA